MQGELHNMVCFGVDWISLGFGDKLCHLTDHKNGTWCNRKEFRGIFMQPFAYADILNAVPSPLIKMFKWMFAETSVVEARCCFIFVFCYINMINMTIVYGTLPTLIVKLFNTVYMFWNRLDHLRII